MDEIFGDWRGHENHSRRISLEAVEIKDRATATFQVRPLYGWHMWSIADNELTASEM